MCQCFCLFVFFLFYARLRAVSLFSSVSQARGRASSGEAVRREKRGLQPAFNHARGILARFVRRTKKKERLLVVCFMRKEAGLIILHEKKKLLDSDWLKAVQFKRNTNAKGVITVQSTHHNSGL